MSEFESDFTEAEAIDDLAHAVRRVASAITPSVTGVNDASGCYVESLTESVIGVTNGLCRIADAIDGLSETLKHFASKG